MAEELEIKDIKYNQSGITPFWKKLPFLFMFPFRAGPLIFMACIVVASALAGIVMGAFGLVFRGFLVYLGLRYAFNVLELFARGRFEGESMDHSLWGPEKRPAKLGVVLALFIVIGINLGNLTLDSRIANDTRAQDVIVARYNQEHAAEIAQREKEMAAYRQHLAEANAARAARARKAAEAAQQGDADTAPEYEDADAELEVVAPEAGPTRAQILEENRPQLSDPLWLRLQPAGYWIAMFILSLMLPSAAVVIALEDKFFKSLNPLNMIYLVQSMKSAYFALWAFFLAIAGARQLAFTAGESWPMFLRFPLEMALATYLGLVLFALMGYALYQFHQELHLDVEVDFDQHRQAGGAEGIAAAGSARAALRQAEPQDPLERKLQPLLASGNVKEAIAEVKDHMRYDRYDPALNTRLHGLYEMQGESESIVAHGQQWLSALARAGQGKEALAALRKIQALDANFTPQDGDVTLPAAQAAVHAHDYTLAAALMRNFDKRFPGHKDIPGVYYLGARLLSEQGRQHEKAAKILRAVVAHFPEHAIAAEAKTYLTVLDGLAAKAASPG